MPEANEIVSHIILIEDHKDQATSLKELLSLFGYKVTVAITGLEGMEKIKAIQPEIVICDIGLPGQVSGYGVAHLIRQDRKLQNIYLIAMTGYAQAKDVEKALDSGFDIHLAKPTELEHLREILQLAKKQVAIRRAARAE